MRPSDLSYEIESGLQNLKSKKFNMNLEKVLKVFEFAHKIW